MKREMKMDELNSLAEILEKIPKEVVGHRLVIAAEPGSAGWLWRCEYINRERHILVGRSQKDLKKCLLKLWKWSLEGETL